MWSSPVFTISLYVEYQTLGGTENSHDVADSSAKQKFSFPDKCKRAHHCLLVAATVIQSATCTSQHIFWKKYLPTLAAFCRSLPDDFGAGAQLKESKYSSSQASWLWLMKNGFWNGTISASSHCCTIFFFVLKREKVTWPFFQWGSPDVRCYAIKWSGVLASVKSIFEVWKVSHSDSKDTV